MLLGAEPLRKYEDATDLNISAGIDGAASAKVANEVALSLKYDFFVVLYCSAYSVMLKVAELRKLLDAERLRIAREAEEAPFHVATNKCLDDLSNIRPDR